MFTQKNTLTLAGCLALLVSTVFYLVLCAAGGGYPASPEPDQTIYLQYARNAALGHPYVFSLGDAPSTGSTTHLYPFVLALLYKLGAADQALFTASFILNSFVYAAIALLSWLGAKKLYPQIATLVLFLSLISGHTASAVFSQTDVGFFAMLALGLIVATLYDRKWWMAGMIILCAVTRPEGAVFSMAFMMAGSLGWVLNKKFNDAPGTKDQAKWFLICSLLGLSAFAFTLLINNMLTGYTQFMSVSNKGYMNLYPLAGAIEKTLFDLLSLIKGFLLNIPNNGRQFYHVPVIAGLLGFAGIFLHPRIEKKIRLFECWILICMGGALLTVASSQWQGLSNDRYLTWAFPIWTWYIFIGVFELAKRLNSRYFVPISCTLLVGFQLISVTVILTEQYTTAAFLNRQKLFAEKIDSTLDPSAVLGSSSGGTGILYYMPNRKVYNLPGILSPDFYDHHFTGMALRLIDRLKHQKDLRFDYWLASTKPKELGDWAQPFLGTAVMMDTDTAIGDPRAIGVYAAQWENLDGGDTPALVDSELTDYQLIDTMDIGYGPHEKKHNYEQIYRMKNTIIAPCATHAKLGENEYSDIGRIIMGSEKFTIQNVQPGKPVRMVLRTTQAASGQCYAGRQTSAIENFEVNNIIMLNIWIDNTEVASPQLNIDGDGFQEVIMDIPAGAVTDTTLNVEIAGDHISYAYWFYQ